MLVVAKTLLLESPAALKSATVKWRAQNDQLVGAFLVKTKQTTNLY